MEKTISPSTVCMTAADLHEAIRHRAEEIYIQSGRVPGRDIENWTRAEHEVMAAAGSRTARAVIVNVNGTQYVGEYQPELSDGYLPGEIGVGAPVTVRLQGEKMFVKRANGKELETRIVQKIG